MKKILLLFVFSFAAIFAADPEGFKPGEYILDGGSGNLTIKKNNQKILFEITTVGGNFHTCGLSGEIKKHQARLEAMDKECVVTFTQKGKDIDVSQSGEECRYYCGARAAFEGLYLEPAAGCDGKSYKKARADFKKRYDKKEYEDALKGLNALFKACNRTIDWIETGWVKNDIAITQYHLGDSAGCRATLKSFQAEAAQSDDEIRNNYPPSDGDAWLPALKAARHNLKLCSGKQRVK